MAGNFDRAITVLATLDELLVYSSVANFPVTGAYDKLYLAEDTNYQYRWNIDHYERTNTYTSGDFTHDDLTGVSADEHIDWTLTNLKDVHPDNYTDTTYAVGNGGLTEINFTTAKDAKLAGIETAATADQTGAEIKTLYQAELNAYTDTKDAKLAGIEANANNYSHPATHAATMIDQDATHRFITDAERIIWNDGSVHATDPLRISGSNLVLYDKDNAIMDTVSLAGQDAGTLDGLDTTRYIATRSELAGGVDLNNYRANGIHLQNSNADAASGLNYPIAEAGMLEVIHDDVGNGLHTFQRYSHYNTNDIYVRTYYNGTWFAWSKIEAGATADQTKADIDALGIDAGTLDGLDSTQFLRSDTADTMTGDLSFNTGSAAPITLTRTSQVGIGLNDTSVGARYLGVNGGELRFGVNLNHGANPIVHNADNFGKTEIDALGISAVDIDGIAFRNGDTSSPINPDSIVTNGTGYINAVSLFGQTDGGLYSQAHSSNWVHQIYGDYRTGQIALRSRNNGVWQAWRTVHDSSNFGKTEIDALNIDADTIDGYDTSTTETINTVAVRNSSGDILARLFRSTYAEQTAAPLNTADFCFRTNNSTDPYMRFVNQAGMVAYLRSGGLANNPTDHTTNNVEYSPVWENNSGSLYTSQADYTYNPALKRLTTGQFTATNTEAFKSEAVGARLRLGHDTLGYATNLGSKANTDAAALNYAAYWAYDCYWDETTDQWKAHRTTIGRKYVAEMGWHKDSFEIKRFDGDVSLPWSDAAMTTLLKVDTTGATASKFTSTVATGTAPLSVSSTTLCTNLNADMLDGRHVNTSGNGIAALDQANTWTGAQTFNAGVAVAGNITVTGTVDGVDVAALESTVNDIVEW